MEWDSVINQFKQTWLTTLMSMILFGGVTCFILWSEIQTIKTLSSLDEVIDAAKTIDFRTQYDPQIYEGKVVHLVGPIHVQEPITEPDYNIQVLAVKLRKRVQMYQWVEETTDQESFLNEPGDESQKTYWYHKDWRDYLIDSNLFYITPGHQNPTSMSIFSETHIAENVKIGWVLLGYDFKRKVDDYYEVWSDSRPDRTDIKLHSGFYYHGESALEHEIGDYRVHFSYAGREDDIYTAIGVLEKGELQPYISLNYPNLDPIAYFRKGSYSLKQMHDVEKKNTHVNTWKYRLFGLVQVYASFMTLHPGWLTILLRSAYMPYELRESRFWTHFVFAFSYTLITISVPWLLKGSYFGLVTLLAALLPPLYYIKRGVGNHIQAD